MAIKEIHYHRDTNLFKHRMTWTSCPPLSRDDIFHLSPKCNYPDPQTNDSQISSQKVEQKAHFINAARDCLTT